MRAFHHPASSSAPGPPCESFGLFAARAKVGREANLLERVPHRGVVGPLVQTPPLGLLLGGTGPRDDHALEGGLDHLQVRAIGPGHPQAHRNARPLGQPAAVAPTCGPVGGMGPIFFPLRAGPWSSLRPCSASARRSLSAPRTAPPRLSTTAESPPPPPISGTGHARGNGDPSPWP